MAECPHPSLTAVRSSVALLARALRNASGSLTRVFGIYRRCASASASVSAEKARSSRIRRLGLSSWLPSPRQSIQRLFVAGKNDALVGEARSEHEALGVGVEQEKSPQRGGDLRCDDDVDGGRTPPVRPWPSPSVTARNNRAVTECPALLVPGLAEPAYVAELLT